MTYEYYIKQPKHMVESKLNLIIAKNPHLINTLDRRNSHPLIRKYSHIPFNNKEMYVTNIADDYDNITDLNFTNNCTINESNIDIIKPTLFFTIPCGLSFLCLISLMMYTLL